ncbi:MAG: 3-dehydroquinate synthase [Verrucomicrobiales bacterium]|jgi:3-dehydroquinate synthase|nr:3-dehydroquinate synthase [Verrucomicrobiales bacterium]|tara:strand:- start:387 stop:1550 length:1164 start_codon:yes stop_codon:yes gene_type:complete
MLERTIHLELVHRIEFTRDLFSPVNSVLSDVVSKSGSSESSKFIVFVDGGVVGGKQNLLREIESWFNAKDGELELVDSPFVLPGAEACKNDWSLIPEIWEKMNRNSIDRHSYVLAIGGGAFLDMVGFAASTAHRGVRLVRVPTTSLSQGDGGVGVKNGINYFGKKNWVGSFSVPFAVINDFAFLESLDDTSRRAGIIEAIKVALVRNKKFFVEIEKLSDRLFKLEQAALEYVIQRSAEEHVDHISTSGDPYELGSARPLDFGHWVAHKLEQISAFRIGHGEAVAVGLAVDLIYSKRVGIISKDDCDRILNLIRSTGFNIYDPELSRIEAGRSVILQGLEEFREHLGGILTITLVPEIGRKIEVNDMDETEILASIDELSSYNNAQVC